MKTNEFDKIVNERIKKIKDILTSKAGEYASEEDRLFNFKIAAKINRVKPAEALWGMASKHLASILKIIEEVGNGKKVQKDVSDEKIGDMINYLILLEAVLEDK